MSRNRQSHTHSLSSINKAAMKPTNTPLCTYLSRVHTACQNVYHHIHICIHQVHSYPPDSCLRYKFPGPNIFPAKKMVKWKNILIIVSFQKLSNRQHCKESTLQFSLVQPIQHHSSDPRLSKQCMRIKPTIFEGK